MFFIITHKHLFYNLICLFVHSMITYGCCHPYFKKNFKPEYCRRSVHFATKSFTIQLFSKIKSKFNVGLSIIFDIPVVWIMDNTNLNKKTRTCTSIFLTCLPNSSSSVISLHLADSSLTHSCLEIANMGKFSKREGTLGWWFKRFIHSF